MKLVKIETNAGKWFNLKKVVKIKNKEGVFESNKFYFNGFEPTLLIILSDGKKYSFTHNHKLRTDDNEWKRVDSLKKGDVFNNGVSVIDIIDNGIQPTMDMEVEDVHYYTLDNGVESHNTSFISGATSGGFEPFMSNIFLKSLAKIQYVWKNPHLTKILNKSGNNTTFIWDNIQDNNGSVQHLDFLSKEDKDIFKTFAEISPKDIIDLTSDRQVFIDMGQSLNLIFRKNYTMKDIYDIHKYAWDKNIKTLYYAYSSAHAALEKDGESWDSCASCAD